MMEHTMISRILIQMDFVSYIFEHLFLIFTISWFPACYLNHFNKLALTIKKETVKDYSLLVSNILGTPLL